jgi:Bacterial Ig-like domain
MKQTAMMRRLAVLLGTTLVAVLALSGLAWAATTPLALTKMVPGSGATELARTVNVKAFFNHDMKASTFKIRKQGTTTWLAGAHSLNNTITPTSTNGSSQSVATLNPDANLAANTTYEVMIVGGSSGVKDVNGSALSANKSWTFKTVTPPETTIDSTTGPTGTVASDSASFAFSSSKSNTTFKCSLDGSTFAACTSPMSYSSLSQGEHTFRVRAIDASGTQDPTPASRSWAVDTVGPNATITDGPPSRSNSLSATFTFSGAEDGGGYQCKISDASSSGTFSACSSGESFTVDTDGTYTFSVRASDALGNFGKSASLTWTVDTVAPAVDSVSPADAATGVSPTANVTATFSEAMDLSTISGQSFTLSKSGSPVSAQVTYDQNSRTATLDPAGNLQAGATYEVRIANSVEDLAGNDMAQEATWSFTVEAASPVTITPNPLDLSPTDVVFCSPRQEFLKVTNNGPGNVTFSDVSITEQDAAYFSDGAKSFIVNNGPFTVLEGNYFQDQVTFRPGPTATDRNRVYKATLTYKDGTGATIGTPVSLTANVRCLNFP